MGINLPAFAAGGCGCASCPRPEITEQPAGVAVCEGAEAELTVTVFGLAPIAYQWYEGESGDTSTPLEGETTDTLQVTPDATTPYWVRVTNPCGYADSDTALVTVNVAPAITAEPESTEICEGSGALLSVTATGTAPLTYQWYLGESGDTGSPIVGATSSTYNAEPGATQDYWVRVTNACGSADSDTATVTVNVAPEITVQPVGGVYDGVTPVSLSVTATGTAPLTYQWQEQPAGGGPWVNIPGATASTYDAEPEEDTNYRVVVTNACGEEVSEPAGVTVLALLIEYSTNGEDWTELEDEDALDLENLAGLELSLRFTSNVELNVTPSSSVPQVQQAPAGPINIPAATPTVISFTARDPGVTDIVLTFDAAPAVNFSVMSYVLAGVARVVNSSPTPPVALTVALAQLSAADVAAAVVYATPELARAAAGDGDWIVFTEAAEFAAPNAITASLRICSDDAVAPVLGRYGDGARMTGLVTLNATGKNIFIHDIGLDSNSSQVVQVTGDSTNIIERCRIRKRGAVFDAVAKISAGTLLLANNYVQVAAGNNGLAHSTGGADGSVVCINNTIIATEAAVANGVFGDDAARRPVCGGNYSGLADGASWTGNAYNANTQAQGAGFNGGNDTSAPGTTAYDNVDAVNFIADDVPATLDMAPIDRTTLEAYPCANNAALSCRDVDKVPRADWFMGAKWLAA